MLTWGDGTLREKWKHKTNLLVFFPCWSAFLSVVSNTGHTDSLYVHPVHRRTNNVSFNLVDITKGSFPIHEFQQAPYHVVAYGVVVELLLAV